MTAMAEMVADMMLKALPEEVRSMLTAENLSNLQQRIVTKWSLVEGSFVTIITAQNATLETMQGAMGMLLDMQAQLDRIEENVGKPNGSGKHSTRKPSLRALPNPERGNGVVVSGDS